ncbi:unnamed protein product [Cylicocyclus nassatus]|uniref:Protein kinase domain-containing protein n=1 Tax=Cylicocyclus nassatus TaxID=53992 RepID=A0AA36GG65_CYLNA|nr:unnamed protein product [Cylicocyclus nassatus]
MSSSVDTPELPADIYKVRWTLNVPTLAEIKEPGQQVRVTDIVKKKLENRIFSAYPAAEEVASGQWWMGRISCIEAGMRLSRDPSLLMGSYAVCQPPEMEPINADEWAEFVLVVRNISGSAEQWIYEWEINHKYNQKFGRKFKERQLGNDIIRGPPASPIPVVAYFKIKRTETGLFYVEPEQTFSSIDLLLTHYHSHALPINGKKDVSKQPFSLILRGISQFDTASPIPPRPMLGPMKKPTYKKSERSPFRLILGDGQKTLESMKARIANRVFIIDNEQKEALYKGYLFYNGKFNPVTIRKQRPRLFKQKAFEKDIQRLSKVGQREKGSKQDANIAGTKNGYEFLSHIVAYGNDEWKYGKWVAYEFAFGVPLDRLLQWRKYKNETMYLREKSEILYQISAGMRFLELNGLCHRHLRASNVILREDGYHMYGVKITDYMLTYHFLDPDVVESINLADLDWPWWAPECVLYKCFDIVSDIWAFGCVIFEINHDGLGPYAFQQHRPQSHQDLQAIFERGEKMEIVLEEDKETFLEELLYMCVRYNPDARPTFAYLFEFFRDVLFDFAEGPMPAIDKYIKKAPKTFQHPKRSKKIPEDAKFLKKEPSTSFT